MKVLKGFKSSKDRVTVVCCANMKGEKRDLLAIGKRKNPGCFKGVRSLPVDCYSIANAWMTSVIIND
jgi:Na+-translocating ferredoxin:NAD+ oxidoreductase RNF subunit RnfB